MKATGKRDKEELRLSWSRSKDPIGHQTFRALTKAVFGVAPNSCEWRTLIASDRDGRCVAGLEVRLFSLVLDGDMGRTAGIRLVAVDPEWRGRGLMRAMMEQALRWCDGHVDLVLLYAAEPDLYARFGFDTVPQHAFVGPAPDPIGSADFRRIDLGDECALVRRLLAGRAAVSGRVSLVGADDLWLHNAAAAEDLALIYSADLDALVAYETRDAETILIDVVAPTIPAASAIAGLPSLFAPRWKTLFPPDRLGWTGEPVAEATGLMARGPHPAAFSKPFMLPPTAEF